MLELVYQNMKQKKYLLYGILYFIIFLSIYFVLDTLNGGYPKMVEDFGLWLVVLNLVINFIMSAISAYMMILSSAYVQLSGKEGKGSFLTSFAVLFGMLTYGCTTCVITFFAVIGITFGVIALPLAGFPYKIMALVLIILGYVWLRYEIKRGRCKVQLPIKKDAE